MPNHFLKTALESNAYDCRVAAELEFYVTETLSDIVAFLASLNTYLTDNHIATESIKAEEGYNQFELVLPPTDPLTLAKQLSWLQNHLSVQFPINLAAKPYQDQPGSSLHIHIHLENNGSNLFSDNAYLEPAIAGMLYFMQEAMILLAPSANCYQRFIIPDQHTPTTISWGGNNRTTALRIPDSDILHKRIELRIASPIAEPADVIAYCIYAIDYGITHQLTPPERIYGNASDQHYQCILLPRSIEDAWKYFTQGQLQHIKTQADDAV